MRYRVLACDYDGTLAHHERVDAATIDALRRLRASGRVLILVTGRQLEELLELFPETALFERAVVENGAVIYHPDSREIRMLADGPAQSFVDALRARKVAPLATGRAIVATWKPHETVVLETIRDLALDLQVIFNKDAVMVLPAGVNKVTGLRAALRELDLSPHEAVGVGDAENDLGFLAYCECGVAVQNALATVKERVDLVTPGDHGRGVVQLIERMLANDLRDVPGPSLRHQLLLGHARSGEEVKLPAFDCNALIAGSADAGKAICKSLTERWEQQHYQYCIIDPDGDLASLEGAVTVGSNKHAPDLDEVMQLLKKPGEDVVISLVGIPLSDRLAFFQTILSRIQSLRSRTGRPHWIVVGAAHELMRGEPAERFERMVCMTAHLEQMAAPALEPINVAIATGPDPGKAVEQLGRMAPAKFSAQTAPLDAKPGEFVVWRSGEQWEPLLVQAIPLRADHQNR